MMDTEAEGAGAATHHGDRAPVVWAASPVPPVRARAAAPGPRPGTCVRGSTGGGGATYAGSSLGRSAHVPCSSYSSWTTFSSSSILIVSRARSSAARSDLPDGVDGSAPFEPLSPGAWSSSSAASSGCAARHSSYGLPSTLSSNATIWATPSARAVDRAHAVCAAAAGGADLQAGGARGRGRRAGRVARHAPASLKYAPSGYARKKISAASRLPQHAARCSGSQWPGGGGGVGCERGGGGGDGGRPTARGRGWGGTGAGARTLFRTAAPSGYVSYIRCTTSARPPKAATGAPANTRTAARGAGAQTRRAARLRGGNSTRATGCTLLAGAMRTSSVSPHHSGCSLTIWSTRTWCRRCAPHWSISARCKSFSLELDASMVERSDESWMCEGALFEHGGGCCAAGFARA